MDPAVELGRRMSRLTSVVFTICILIGLAIAFVLFMLLMALQWSVSDLAHVEIAVAPAVIIGVGGMIWVATRLRRALLAARTPKWIDELAGYHREQREELEQIASLWS